MERGERALVLVVRDKAADDPGLAAAEAARRATALALGAAGLALEIVRAILSRSGPTGAWPLLSANFRWRVTTLDRSPTGLARNCSVENPDGAN